APLVVGPAHLLHECRELPELAGEVPARDQLAQDAGREVGLAAVRGAPEQQAQAFARDPLREGFAVRERAPVRRLLRFGAGLEVAEGEATVPRRNPACRDGAARLGRPARATGARFRPLAPVQ